MRKLFVYLKGSLLFLLLAPLLMIVEVICDLLQPTLMANIIDIGVANRDLAYMGLVGGQMLLTAILGLVGGFGCLYFSAHATAAVGGRLRQALFNHIQTFSFKELDLLKTSTLVTRLTNDVTQIQNMLLSGQRILVRAPLLCVGGLIMAYALSPQLSVVFVVALPILLTAILIIVRKTMGIFGIVQQKIDHMNTISRETLLGIKVIKAFVTQSKQQEKFNRSNTELLAWNIKAQRMMIMLTPFVTFVINVTVITVLWLGGNLVVSGGLEIGKIMAFITYILQIMQSLLMSMMVMMTISRAAASAERINAVFDTTTSILEPECPQTPAHYDLTFNHVYFKYNLHSDWVLKDITFTAREGETIGILGATGSGKSSLVALIPRLYEVSDGEILLGGLNVKALTLSSLRQEIGLVLQDATLFSGTVADNLRFGQTEATDEALFAALADAAADDFVRQKSGGLDSTVEQRGHNLSGGQKQRLAIARTLLKNPRILILDDSTSALDLSTEARLQKALAKRLTHCTKLIIAQRIASIQKADRILVLDQGALIAQGTHQTLMANCEIYRTIAQSQLGEEVAQHA